MNDKSPPVQISESAIVLILLVAMGAYLVFTFFESWSPVLRELR